MCEIVHFETTGCRLNQIESESAARFFSEKSFSVSMTLINGPSMIASVTLWVRKDSAEMPEVTHTVVV